jgi:hypothetical protein
LINEVIEGILSYSSIQNITAQETPEAAFCAALRGIADEAKGTLLTGNECGMQVGRVEGIEQQNRKSEKRFGDGFSKLASALRDSESAS